MLESLGSAPSLPKGSSDHPRLRGPVEVNSAFPSSGAAPVLPKTSLTGGGWNVHGRDGEH